MHTHTHTHVRARSHAPAPRTHPRHTRTRAHTHTVHIMQQLRQDGTWGELDERVEKQVIGIRKRFFACRTQDGRRNTTSYSDLLRWFAQIEVSRPHVLCAAACTAVLYSILKLFMLVSYYYRVLRSSAACIAVRCIYRCPIISTD